MNTMILTRRMHRFGILALLLMFAMLAKADVAGFGKKGTRTWVPVRIEIMNAHKFKGVSFYLSYDADTVNGETEDMLIEIEPGHMPLRLVGKGDCRLAAQDGKGVFKSKQTLAMEWRVYNEDVDYALARVKILKMENGTLTYKISKVLWVEEREEGPKFLKADVVNETGGGYTYLLIALACAAGLGLFFVIRRRSNERR